MNVNKKEWPRILFSISLNGKHFCLKLFKLLHYICLNDPFITFLHNLIFEYIFSIYFYTLFLSESKIEQKLLRSAIAKPLFSFLAESKNNLINNLFGIVVSIGTYFKSIRAL